MHKYKRPNFIQNKILIVDGYIGGGKGLISGILNYFEDVEMWKNRPEIEDICGLTFANEISNDTAAALIQSWIDQDIYNASLLRHANFRYQDQSSIFRYPNKIEYIKRFFEKNTSKNVDSFLQKKKILHIMIHATSPYSQPIFDAFDERLVFVRVVRSPVSEYMINHLANWTERWSTDFKSSIPIKYQHDSNGVASAPFFVNNIRDFDGFNKYKKAAVAMMHWQNTGDQMIDKIREQSKASIIEIPFENFVLSPWDYLKKIEHSLGTKRNKRMMKYMKREKVPRTDLYDAPFNEYFYKMGWRKPFTQKTTQEQLADDILKLSSILDEETFELLKKENEKYISRYSLQEILS